MFLAFSLPPPSVPAYSAPRSYCLVHFLEERAFFPVLCAHSRLLYFTLKLHVNSKSISNLFSLNPRW